MDSITISSDASREVIYTELFPQIKALVEGEEDAVANLSNIAAALREALGFFWIGFYLVKPGKSGDELVLGPCQGPVACTRIAYGKGVCGTAWKENRTILVPDVEAFPGHIACNSASRSEVVVPVRKNGTVVAVIDADSDRINDFSDTDSQWLEKIAGLVSEFL